MKNLKYSKDYITYPAKEQGVYSIEEKDWNRIKELIHKLIPEKKIFKIIYSILFGIFASSIFSLLTFYSLSNLPNWILPTNWAITVASLIVGVAFIIIDNQQKEIIKITSNFIIEEMNNIELQFIKEN